MPRHFRRWFHGEGAGLDSIAILGDTAGMNYPGGKGGVYQKLINLMPPHEVYIETHLGGGAVIRNKRPAHRNIGIDMDPLVIKAWSQMPTLMIELIQGDALEFLKGYPFTGKELIYCDPPYLQETRRGGRLYNFEYTVGQHRELLETIKALPCMAMISGYYSEMYAEALKGWNSLSFQAMTRQGPATEWVWFNYPFPVELHDYRYLGESFRERERIKRKTTRWKARLAAMPLLERQALLAAITANRREPVKQEFQQGSCHSLPGECFLSGLPCFF